MVLAAAVLGWRPAWGRKITVVTGLLLTGDSSSWCWLTSTAERQAVGTAGTPVSFVLHGRPASTEHQHHTLPGPPAFWLSGMATSCLLAICVHYCFDEFKATDCTAVLAKCTLSAGGIAFNIQVLSAACSGLSLHSPALALSPWALDHRRLWPALCEGAVSGSWTITYVYSCELFPTTIRSSALAGTNQASRTWRHWLPLPVLHPGNNCTACSCLSISIGAAALATPAAAVLAAGPSTEGSLSQTQWSTWSSCLAAISRAAGLLQQRLAVLSLRATASKLQRLLSRSSSSSGGRGRNGGSLTLPGGDQQQLAHWWQLHKAQVVGGRWTQRTSAGQPLCCHPSHSSHTSRAALLL